MRTVKLGGLAITSWLYAAALFAGCLQVDDVSLGALERDAGSEREAPDVGAPPPSVVMLAPDAGWAEDAREEMEDEDEEERRALARDAGLPMDAAALADDAGLISGPLDAGVEAGADAGSGDARDGAVGADSGPLDAGSDAQRSLLCTLEPWHCL